MKKEIGDRFDALLSRGEELIRKLPRAEYGGIDMWVESQHVPEFHAWMSSAANLVLTLVPAESHYRKEYDRLMENELMEKGLPSDVIQKMYGLLRSAKDEWDAGLLRRVEHVIFASAFDDFLDHASLFHKSNKKMEAAVLASAVLEDTMKKITAKHALPSSGKSLEEQIDALAKAGVLTPVKAKRVRAWAGTRKHAFHDEWDLFDIRDAGDLIDGTRELIDEFL